MLTCILVLLFSLIPKKGSIGDMAAPWPPGGNLLLESTFEDVSGFDEWTKEICRPEALSISNEVARKGKGAARFEFTKADVTAYKGYVRAEIRRESEVESERWYGFS
jgi:hypothetical protein